MDLLSQTNFIILISFVLGVLLGSLFFGLLSRSKRLTLQELLKISEKNLLDLKSSIESYQQENISLKEELSRVKTLLESERVTSQEKLESYEQAKRNLTDVFKALASDALKDSNQSFLELAKTSLETFQEKAKGDLETRQKAIHELVNPVRDSLDKVDKNLKELENVRIAAYSTLFEQVKSLTITQSGLKEETSKLVNALHRPSVRGRWGEIQLRRVVEMAGMLNYCDFVEQKSISTEEGRLRPDLIVKLPGGKNIVVDAKAPLEAYLNALEDQNENSRKSKLEQHAKQVRTHINNIGSKKYWEQFEPTPDFVVMFLPGEMFFSTALEQDPSLIEVGIEQNVIPASPTTLIALLRAVAYGWKQERVAQSAQEVSSLGKKLYERLIKFVEHLEKMGKGLNNAVEAYNKAVGSLEQKVLAPARKFQELGAATSEDLPILEPIDKNPRQLRITERKTVFEKETEIGEDNLENEN